MTNTQVASRPNTPSNTVSRITRQISPGLSALAGSGAVAGIMAGLIEYLNRSPIREAPAHGTSAWVPHLIVAAVLVALYFVARSRHRRRFGRDSGRLLLLAPLGRSAATRVKATMSQVSWRSAVALPLLGLIAYSFWRSGEQVFAGLDPNFTVNAWGGPTYLGAMVCHYLDAALMIAASAWLLNLTLVQRPDQLRRESA